MSSKLRHPLTAHTPHYHTSQDPQFQASGHLGSQLLAQLSPYVFRIFLAFVFLFWS